MIARLRGELIERRPEYVVLDVNGVGYRVFVSLNTFYALPAKGSKAELVIHTSVRDDAIHLFGFADEAEKEAFNQLCSVSGVGPKLGIGILSGISVADLRLAVKNRDTARLVKVPGIGKKTANRLVLELEGKLPPAGGTESETAEASAGSGSPVAEDAISALMNLGYPEATARKQVVKALKEAGDAPDLEDVLKAALKTGA